MHPLAPHHVLMIDEYVGKQLDDILRLQQQSMSAMALDLQNGARI